MKQTRQLTQDERVATVYGVMATIAVLRVPDEIGVPASQRAIKLLKSMWDDIPAGLQHDAANLLKYHDKIKTTREEINKEKQKSYDRSSN